MKEEETSFENPEEPGGQKKQSARVRTGEADPMRERTGGGRGIEETERARAGDRKTLENNSPRDPRKGVYTGQTAARRRQASSGKASPENRQERSARPEGNRQERSARPEGSRQERSARPEGSRQERSARPEGNRQAKSARPERSRQANQPGEGAGRSQAARARQQSARLRRRKAALRRRRILLIAAGAAGILLLVLLIFLARGCRKGKTDEAGSTGLSGQQSFAVTGGEDSAEADSGEAAPTPTPEPTKDPYADKPNIDINSWEYILANASHSIEDYSPEVAPFEEVYLDHRIIDAMQSFVDGARSQGLNVVMASGYRDYYEQSALFENKAAEYGEEKAATIVAPPGTSEHQTGLAADITDDYYEYKNESLENTDLYKWMSTHCQDYGFIVRFPKGKEEVTGIIYEPWHFRYVGVEAASYIMEHNLTLEEFLQLYGKN